MENIYISRESFATLHSTLLRHKLIFLKLNDYLLTSDYAESEFFFSYFVNNYDIKMCLINGLYLGLRYVCRHKLYTLILLPISFSVNNL
jgi:hypothetical protein